MTSSLAELEELLLALQDIGDRTHDLVARLHAERNAEKERADHNAKAANALHVESQALRRQLALVKGMADLEPWE